MANSDQTEFDKFLKTNEKLLGKLVADFERGVQQIESRLGEAQKLYNEAKTQSDQSRNAADQARKQLESDKATRRDAERQSHELSVKINEATAELQQFHSNAEQLHDKQLHEAVRTNENINAQLTTFEAHIAEKRKDIDQAVRDARVAAGKEGFERHVRTFAAAEKRHTRASEQWLKAAIVGAVTTASLSVIFACVPITGELDGGAISQIISRLFIISILLFFTVWCGKNYRVNQHLAISNMHRVCALATYKSFIGLAVEDTAADEILLEATKYVFTHAQSGYLGKDEDTPVGQLVELTKAVTGK